MISPISDNEGERLQELWKYQILDTPPESAFDKITQAARQICDTPIALISFVDEHRLWFKSNIGIQASEMSRNEAFCTYAILQPDILVVPNALEDERFATHPFVESNPKIRFYAGAPLQTPTGHRIGTLCVIDYKPRELQLEQISALQHLSQQVVQLLQEKRSQTTVAVKVRQQHHKAQQQKQFLRRIAARFSLVSATIIAIGGVVCWEVTRAIQNERWVSHTFEVVASLEGITADIKDVQIFAQNYAVTKQQQFLVSYKAIIPGIYQDLDKIQRLTADNSKQQQNIGNLRFLVHNKIALLDRTIQKLQPQQAGLVGRDLLTEEDIEVTEELNRVLREMKQEEQHLLRQRSKQTMSDVGTTSLEFLAGSFFILVLIVVIYRQVYREIKQQRKIENDLEQQRDFTNVVLDTVKAMVVVLDNHGRILRFNRTCEQTTGYSLDEVQGNYLWDCFLSPEEAELVKARHKQPKVEQFPSQYECHWVSRTGDRYLIRWSSTALLDGQGQLSYTINTGIDITKQRQTEEQMQRTLAKEKEVNELKSNFVSLVSHEFRTPLTVILSSVDFLNVLHPKWTADRQKRHCAQIQIAVKRMTNLLNDVLLVSRAEAGKLTYSPTLLDLEHFCHDLIAEFELIVDDTYHLMFSCSTEAANTNVWMDENLLRHIFTNLLSNAIKYSPSGGAIQLQLYYQDGAAVLSVQDQGIGIPSEDLSQLFKRFYRSSNVSNVPGTGLGLFIAKTCVDLHGGEITVSSEVNCGTTFIVRLPFNKHSSFNSVIS